MVGEQYTVEVQAQPTCSDATVVLRPQRIRDFPQDSLGEVSSFPLEATHICAGRWATLLDSLGLLGCSAGEITRETKADTPSKRGLDTCPPEATFPLCHSSKYKSKVYSLIGAI